MRFSTGLWDFLFGEKIILQGSDEKGNVIQCKLSKKWLARAQIGENFLTSSPERTNNEDQYSPSMV